MSSGAIPQSPVRSSIKCGLTWAMSMLRMKEEVSSPNGKRVVIFLVKSKKLQMNSNICALEGLSRVTPSSGVGKSIREDRNVRACLAFMGEVTF